MRYAIIALAVLAAACGQPAPETTADARAGSSGAGNVAEEAFALESEALVGLWSFDRTCGLYDLVFEADGDAIYYDYSGDAAITYIGTWRVADNRVVLTTRVQSADGAMETEATTYNVDVAAPVTDDLIARLARADGAEARDITARRCAEEDRD